MAEEMMEQEQVESYTKGATDPEGLNEQQKGQVEAYIKVLMTLIHSDKTHQKVLEMLKGSKDPFITIPQAAVSINDMGVNLMTQKGKAPHFGIQLAASSYLLEDLIEIGMAMGQFERPTEEELAGIYEDSIQMVVERGLQDGSIDPIQLQLDVEPLMDENQKRAGDELSKRTGLEAEPSEAAIREQYANKKVQKREGQLAKQNAREKAKALKGGPPQGQPQGPPQGQPQGGM